MRTRNLLSAISTLALAVVFFASSSFAQTDSVQTRTRTQTKAQTKSQVKTQVKIQNQNNKFVDANSDGYNDNAPDADGDGIPNGQDADYVGATNGKGFVDLNGDGINDNAFDSDGDGIPNGQDSDFVRPEDGSGRKVMNGKSTQTKFGGNKYGPGDGTGTGVVPNDGTGYGPGDGTSVGTGTKRGGRK
jgi:hypothetical protein